MATNRQTLTEIFLFPWIFPFLLQSKYGTRYTSRFLRSATRVSYYTVPLSLLQVVVPLRVLWGYTDATACVKASFVTVASEYPHSTFNGTATYSSHSSTNRSITAYLLLRVNLDKIMLARWDFDVSSARTWRVSALDKHQNWSACALFCLNFRAQSKYAVVHLIHTQCKQTFLSFICDK